MADDRILLVEGEDDEHVVRHLYREVYGSDPPFEIVNKEGYAKLLKGLPRTSRDPACSPWALWRTPTTTWKRGGGSWSRRRRKAASPCRMLPGHPAR